MSQSGGAPKMYQVFSARSSRHRPPAAFSRAEVGKSRRLLFSTFITTTVAKNTPLTPDIQLLRNVCCEASPASNNQVFLISAWAPHTATVANSHKTMACTSSPRRAKWRTSQAMATEPASATAENARVGSKACHPCSPSNTLAASSATNSIGQWLRWELRNADTETPAGNQIIAMFETGSSKASDATPDT